MPLNGKTKKAHWFPSASVVALATLVVCSLYGILSPIVIFRRWDNVHNYTMHSQVDLQQPFYPEETKNRESTRALVNATSSTKQSKLDIASESSNNNPFVRPIAIERIQTQLSRLSLNATIVNNDNDVILQRERVRVLEVLMNYFSETSPRLESDIVELRHCRLDMIDFSQFSSWAAVILLDAGPRIEKMFGKKADQVKDPGKHNTTDDESLAYLEFSLGLLEVFATHSKGEGNVTVCDFEDYPLNPRGFDLLSAESALGSIPLGPDGLPRLVFVIVAFQDALHLEALIEACHMPHHLIVVHLERRSPSSFSESVLKIANKYTNVVVVQFGSIIYKTDSVSLVNYQIMHWVTEELKFPYDYYLTLGNAVYPLYGAQELTNYFRTTERDIWLGELRSHMNAGWIHWAYLERKRLVFTAGDQKHAQRTKKWKQNGFDSPIPEYIKTNMTEKTNSGNQAVFSYKVVKKLVNSPQVKELFGVAKYGCCCCLEERTWIAAANMIGYGKEALEAASMFQVWGGEPECGDGSMRNALLQPNAAICYKSDDATKGNLFERQQKSVNDTSIENSYFRGDKLLEELRLAKKRGFLFARKFKSTDQSSMKLVELIQTNIHNH